MHNIISVSLLISLRVTESQGVVGGWDTFNQDLFFRVTQKVIVEFSFEIKIKGVAIQWIIHNPLAAAPKKSDFL